MPQSIDLSSEGDGPEPGSEPDQTLDFSIARIVAGRAFLVDDANETSEHLPVAKSVVTVRGRTFLIEAVSHPAVKERFARLSKVGQAGIQNHREGQWTVSYSGGARLLTSRLARTLAPPKGSNSDTTGQWADLHKELPEAHYADAPAQMLLAANEKREEGFVLDYLMLVGLPTPAGIIS